MDAPSQFDDDPTFFDAANVIAIGTETPGLATVERNSDHEWISMHEPYQKPNFVLKETEDKICREMTGQRPFPAISWVAEFIQLVGNNWSAGF